MATIKKDWGAVMDAMESGVKDLLNSMIDGAIEDLDGPIRQTAARLTLAAKRGDQALVEESRDQLMLLVLEKRLRLMQGGSRIMERMLLMGMNALVNGAVAGLAGLKVV